MKYFQYLIVIAVVLLGFTSCDPDEPTEANFKDLITETAYDYIVKNDSLYSKFLAILEAGSLDKTMSAYNPNGNG
ncbi:MAG: hypothetical protein JXR22_12405, partial [Prolixibacteraceae bacterium]|nr:hypothetical protein [Prolixibacteraceae bacterium]